MTTEALSYAIDEHDHLIRVDDGYYRLSLSSARCVSINEVTGISSETQRNDQGYGQEPVTPCDHCSRAK